MGLKRVSTKPSASDVALRTHHGNVPLPDCLRTLGALGAVGSFSTVQRGVPRPVTPQTQAGGVAPTFRSSKLMVSMRAPVRVDQRARPSPGRSRDNRQ